MESIYRVDGGRVETGPDAAGPWDPTTQHGAAPAALVTWAAERGKIDFPARIARVTLDFLRPVPLAPLDIQSHVVRGGRKIQVSSISLFADGREVVRASVLKVRTIDLRLPANLPETTLDAPLPELCPERTDNRRIRCPFLEGISSRIVSDRVHPLGRGLLWFKVDRPIVDGEAVTPAMRAAIAADFCNGVSTALDLKTWSFINGDLTLSLVRLPIGDWILVNAETSLGPDGGGMATARLADRIGYFGRAAQSLIIDRR
jgi:hypothetical protein